jgi:hypothetical protein
VVLDEAQAIKNERSQAAKAARLLQAEQGVALTGTPARNYSWRSRSGSTPPGRPKCGTASAASRGSTNAARDAL